ncbi:signal peptidase II [Clostridium argentinense CDC 2741]|uniref:Lipoprotein signal peptidase n=1 Tax=Clostridium argentinense CDC 2741 TaxID=1418104 RepID=A0A0C1U2Q1_9CLOT|nr:signal peptidase II [Clostridium argentinense]HAG44187.1 signal peptidase II [Clostridium sp.]ARC85257.1 signal peptidase II [Clostridium argentinense]KIE47134.1 signal peptidase II [Clostridium argentinense CDC 2741]NFF40873.1 signal peptidase II [Clostridium argentinense]NFP51415.1 signal peptidase II [Clostridium argentinense]
MALEFIIIFLGMILDRLSKIWALKVLKNNEGIEIIKNLLSFEYLENRGAAFGMLQNKLWFLATTTFLVVGVILFYLIKYKPKSLLTRISFAMIISGAIGNFYDRVVYKYVVDFILVHYKDVYYFPTFNVADIFVTLGTIGLIICIIRNEV